MPIEWISLLKKPLLSAASNLFRRGHGWLKRRRVQKAARNGESLATKYSLEELVKAELLRLASLGEEAYPTSVQPAAFRNWLRSDGNLADFVDVVIAYAGNRPDSVAPVVRRLIRHYESLAHGSPAAAQSQIQFVANSLIGQLEISEPGRMALGNPLLRRLAASSDPRSNEEQRQEDRLARVRPFAESLVESGKRSWKMPRFVAPLTLEAYEQNENERRSTSSAELVASIEKGIPLLLYGEGGIGKTFFTLELAEHCLRSGSRVPIFVDGAAWARANKPLLQYLVERPAALRHTVSVTDLTTLACAGQLVLLLNGWNEMPAASKLTCLEDLIQLLETASALSVVTVTRTHTDAPGLAWNQSVKVLGLTWKGQSAIIRAELDDESAAQLVAVLAKNSVLRHAARSPLILRGVIAKARSGITSEATVIDLLGASVAAFEADAQRSHVLNTAPLEGHQARFLEAIGRSLTDRTLTSYAREDALKVITGTSHQLLVDGLFSTVPSSSAVLDALVNHHLLHAQDDDVRFVHQRFQEYFAAQSLWKTCFNNTDTARLANAINAPAWNEVLFMLAERLRLQSTTPLLRTRLVAAAAAIDLGIACELAGACGFSSTDDATLHSALITAVTAFSNSSISPIRTLATMYQVISGFPEFAASLWPYLEDPNGQPRSRAHLHVEMGVSMKQLGPSAQERIAAWPADRRAAIVRELGHNADNYDFLVDLAHNEPDDVVRIAAITALLWHFPASEEAVKAWLNAPLSVQSSQDARSQVVAALRQDYLPAEINDRIRHVLRSDLTPEVQVELALALPDKVTPAGLDAILGLLEHNIEYGPRTPEVLQIAQDRAPDRLLQLAVANAFAGPKAGGWIQEVLNNAPPAIQEEIVDRAWERVQSNEFRTVNGEIVGPLADRYAIARGIDLSLRYKLATAGTLTAADHEYDRAVQEILRHVDPQMLLAEIIARSTQASYPQSAHLLQLTLLRIGRDPGDPRTQNGWLPTSTEVRELIEAFAGKVDPAAIPSVTVNVYLASIASYVAPNEFAAFLLQTCREFLDAWALYDDHLERWDPATGAHRPNNPPWLLRLFSVFSRWGPAALPGLLGLMEHRAAEALIPEAIGRAAAAPWAAKELEFSRYVSTDIRDGNARREHGRILQQPDNSFQQQTDSAARVLGQRLLMLLSAFQGPPAPGRHGPHSGDYRIGKLAQVVAHLPSPEILGPTSSAIASGLMNMYAQANCVRGLVRQGVRLENSEAVNQFETSYLTAVAPEWLDQSSHFALGEASQLLLCTIAQERLSRPATFYLTQWRRFSNSREIVRRLGETADPACWPVLFDAVRATTSDRDGLAENAMAVASLLSPATFPQFLQLVEDGTFLRWCGDSHNLKRVLPHIIRAVGGVKERINALTTACRTTSEPLAVGLAVGVLRDGHQNDALVQLLLEALDAGKLTYPGSPWRDFLLDPFRAETPIGDYQSSVTMQSCNDLRQALYSRAKAGGPLSITCKTLLAELERQRRDIDRPFDEPRHPAIADGIAWTDVLASDTPA